MGLGLIFIATIGGAFLLIGIYYVAMSKVLDKYDRDDLERKKNRRSS